MSKNNADQRTIVNMIAHPIDAAKYIGHAIIDSFNCDGMHGNAESRGKLCLIVDLPLDYKEFLLEYGGCFIKEHRMYQPIEVTPVTPEDGFDSIGGFYGITSNTYNIESIIQTYKDVLGSIVMPIADADGGDLICIGLRGKYRGKVYFWYHEGEISNGENEYYYLIANSFEEFISKFIFHERNTHVNLDDIDLFLDDLPKD